MAGSARGAIRAASARLGMAVDEYERRLAAGLKRCVGCGEWMETSAFGRDSSRGDGYDPRCLVCRKIMYRRRYIRVPEAERMPKGPSRLPPSDGDKQQARKRVQHDVEDGVRPNPNDLYCAKCGHRGSDRRHEYHHHMGYGAEHHLDVLPLCSTCHHAEHAK